MTNKRSDNEARCDGIDTQTAWKNSSTKNENSKKQKPSAKPEGKHNHSYRTLLGRRRRDDKYRSRPAGFAVLRWTKMPAMLIENLFHDNPKDADMLINPDYMEDYTSLEADWIEWCIKEME